MLWSGSLIASTMTCHLGAPHGGLPVEVSRALPLKKPEEAGKSGGEGAKGLMKTSNEELSSVDVRL